MPSPNSNGLHPDHHALLTRLAERIRAGQKTLAGARLYLAEYDRIHGVNLSALLDAYLNDLPQPPPAGDATRARGRRKK